MKKEEAKVLNFRNKNEMAADNQTIKAIVVIQQDGTERKFTIQDGMVLMSDTAEGHMVSILQGSPEYIGHCLNLLITLIGASRLPSADMVTLYQFMQNLTLKTFEGIDLVLKQYTLMKQSIPTPKEREN